MTGKPTVLLLYCGWNLKGRQAYWSTAKTKIKVNMTFRRDSLLDLTSKFVHSWLKWSMCHGTALWRDHNKDYCDECGFNNGEIRAVFYDSVYNIILYILYDIVICFGFFIQSTFRQSKVIKYVFYFNIYTVNFLLFCKITNKCTITINL